MVTGEAFVALLPELVATGFLILTLLVGVFGERNVGLVAAIAALGSLAVFGSAAGLMVAGFSGSFFGGGFVVDDFALYFKLIVAGSAFFAVLAAARWSGYTGDAGPVEMAAVVPLAVLLLVLGIFPALLTSVQRPAVEAVLSAIGGS